MSIKTKLMTACAGVVLGSATIASATLTIDLRVTDVGSTPIATYIANNPGASNKNIPNIAAKNNIKFNVYAIVSGTKTDYVRTQVDDPDTGLFKNWLYEFDYADGFQSASGSITTRKLGDGAVVGDLKSGVKAGAVVSGWDGNGAKPGNATADFTGDGVLDLGAPNGTVDANQYINYRNKAQMAYDPSNVLANVPNDGPDVYDRPANDPAVREFLIGKGSFLVGTPTGANKGQTVLNWSLRADANGATIDNAALWEEDRLPLGYEWIVTIPDPTKPDEKVYTPKENDPKNGTNGTILLGAPIVLGTIPEPMSLSVMGIGAALLGFRRPRR